MPLRMIRVDSTLAGHGMKMHWNAIAAGAFLTLGLGAFFLLLGNAVGLNLSNTVNPNIRGSLQFWSWIYMAATMVFSYFLGNSIATRSNEIATPGEGALHALASWGLATTIGFTIAAFISPLFRLLLVGGASNTANWLAICIPGLGLFASIMGGMMGKHAPRYSRIVETGRAIETDRRIAS